MAELPPGFSFDADPKPESKIKLPTGWSFDADPVAAPAPAPQVAAKPASEYKREPLPTTLPEDPFERAALRTRREAATPRPDTPLARLPEATGEAIQSAGKTAKGLLTGELEPTPENVMPAVTATITPGVRGAAQVARTAAEKAMEGMPRFTTSAAKQRMAEKLAEVPWVGKPIRDAAQKGVDEFAERATVAATRPTGTIPSQQRAGEAVHAAIAKEKAKMSPMEVTPHGGKVTDLPWQLRNISKSAAPENATMGMVDLAGKGKNGDPAVLARVKANMNRGDWQEVQGASLGRLGWDGQQFDPVLMLHKYETQLSDGGRNLLFGNPVRFGAKGPTEGTLRHHLDSLVTDSKRMDALRTVPERASIRAGLAAGGWALAHPMSAVGAAVGGRVLAKWLASPVTAAPLAQWSNAYVRMMQAGATPAAIASFKIATRNLENSTGTKIDPDKLIEAMKSGPKPQRATDPEAGGIGDIVRGTMKLAPKGIKAESMRQAWDSIDDRRARPTSTEDPEAFNAWVRSLGDQKTKMAQTAYDYYSQFIPSTRPGQLGRDAGLDSMEQRMAQSDFMAPPELEFQPPPSMRRPVPMPRPRPLPKKGKR